MQVSELKSSFILATNYEIAKLGIDVLNLSTTHAIIEQHLVDITPDLPLSQNNCYVNR